MEDGRFQGNRAMTVSRSHAARMKERSRGKDGEKKKVGNQETNAKAKTAPERQV